jgi:hypothetical protein
LTFPAKFGAKCTLDLERHLVDAKVSPRLDFALELRVREIVRGGRDVAELLIQEVLPPGIESCSTSALHDLVIK